MTITLNGTTGITTPTDTATTSVTTPLLTSAASTALTIQSAGTTAMTVDTSQNVGIGTTSPAYKLEVTGTNGIIGATGSAGYGAFTATGSGTNSSYIFFRNATNGEQARITSQNGGNLIFGNTNSATDRMVIDSSGNLLVGTASRSSTERLKVDNTGTLVAWFQQSTNTSGYNGITVSIGQNGNDTSSYFFRGNTNNVGNWFLYGNGTTSFTSDARLKKNIETTRDGYIDDVMKLRVVKYNWRNDEDGKSKELGLIAQEVAEVFPGLVQDDPSKISETDDTIYKQLKGSVLPFILLKCIQELSAKNDSLEAANAAFEARLAALEAK